MTNTQDSPEHRGRRLEDFHPLLQPARQIYVAVLFLLMIAALVGSYFYLQQKFQNTAHQACQRANQVRVESNQRIAAHVEDAHNLNRLLAVTGHTRKLEADAWYGIYRVLNSTRVGYAGLNRTMLALIRTYHYAEGQDNAIRKRELALHFDKLQLVDCGKVG